MIDDEMATRAGHVALVGRPNVGKSTLLNALVGEKLSIVTPKAQTTRETVTGILTTGRAQAIFVDTPGLLEPRYTLQRAMRETALEVLADADLVLLLLDGERPNELPDPAVIDALRRKGDSIFVLINKIDTAGSSDVEDLTDWSRQHLGVVPRCVSAVSREGVDALRMAIETALPPNPFFYPDDDLAIQPVRFFVAELIRETIFELYDEEVPYSAIVRIEEYREAADPLFIRATVYVERESQKPIVIGRGGAQIKKIGIRARHAIEELIESRVHLELRVKVEPKWTKKPARVRALGYV
jgi:GTP-binding protein Era